MAKCYFCLEKERVAWSGYYCSTCEDIQNISKTYGFERMKDIVNLICVRNEEQLEAKLKLLNKKPTTKSKSF